MRYHRAGHAGVVAVERAASTDGPRGSVESPYDGAFYDEIDAMYTSLFRELLTYMMEDPRNITPCTHLLFCAKNIERIGDHTTNIAETVYFLVSGETLSQQRPKGDDSNTTVLDHS